MALSFGAQVFILLAFAASLMVVGEARTFVVGGSEGWRFGFNYTDWALKTSPFYLHDKLGEYRMLIMHAIFVFKKYFSHKMII